MEEIIMILAAVALMGWLYIFLPVGMAEDRNRGPIVWMLLTWVFTPWVLLILYAIGNAPAEEEAADG